MNSENEKQLAYNYRYEKRNEKHVTTTLYKSSNEL